MRSRHPSRALPAFFLAVMVPWCAGQGVISLSGSWRFGTVAGDQGGICATAGPSALSDHGIIVFQPGGSFTLTSSVHDICPGALFTTTPEADSGLYTVTTDSRVILDFNPLSPGTDIEPIFIRPDMKMAVDAPDGAVEELGTTIALMLSSGQGNGSLNGAYHVVRQTYTQTATALNTVSDFGTITFDGVGGWTETGTRRSLAQTGVTTSSAYSTSGTYSVASDGTLTVNGLQSGCLSFDGEVFFWVESAGPSAGLTVGVKKPTAAAASSVAGDWAIACAAIQTGSGAGLPAFSSITGPGSFTATGSASGNWNVNTTEVNLPAGATFGTVLTGTTGGTWSVSPDGSLSVSEPGLAAMNGGLSASGKLLVLRRNEVSSSGMILGVRTCPWPTSYSFAVPGSGGLVPLLTPKGGYPYLGNTLFGLRVSQAVGGATAILGVSLAPSPTIVAIDLNVLLFQVVLPLPGAASVPGAGIVTMPLSIPAIPSLEGVSVYAQAFVLDPGGTLNLAITKALEITLCR